MEERRWKVGDPFFLRATITNDTFEEDDSEPVPREPQEVLLAVTKSDRTTEAGPAMPHVAGEPAGVRENTIPVRLTKRGTWQFTVTAKQEGEVVGLEDFFIVVDPA